MSTMISLTVEQVPVYLSGSDFHCSLCAEDKEEFSVPSKFFKLSPDLVTIPSDLSLLLHTITFWGVQKFPRELIEFLLKKPPSAKVRDQVCAVLSEFDSDFKLLDMYRVFAMDNDVNARLEAAARSGRTDILEYLVTSKKQVSGATVRMAAEYGLEDHLRRLTVQLQSNNKNPFVQVSMRVVARNGHAECLRFLLRNECPKERTVCYYAAEMGHRDCVQIAHEAGCYWDMKVPSVAALHGHTDCLAYLLVHDCPTEKAAVYNASANGHLDCLRLLLDHGAPATRRLCHIAAEKGHLTCLQLLRERGATWDIDCARVAAMNNHVDCLQFMVENNINCDTSVTETAAKHGSTQCLAYLMSVHKPANYLAVNVAATGGHVDCLRVLCAARVPYEGADHNIWRGDQDRYVCSLVDAGYTLPAETASSAIAYKAIKCLTFLCSIPNFPLSADHVAQAAKNGDLSALKVLHEHHCPWDARACATAASAGHMSCLIFLHVKRCEWDVRTCTGAIEGRNLDCLRYAIDHGAPVDATVCAAALRLETYSYRYEDNRPDMDRFKLLRYLHEEVHCPMDESTATLAAMHHPLPVLQYVHKAGCLWGTTTTAAAAGRNSTEWLQYLHEHNCPWDESTPTAAASTSAATCLTYALTHGCPYSADLCTHAAKRDHPCHLQAAREHGCPWDASTTTAATTTGSVDALRYALVHGCPYADDICAALDSARHAEDAFCFQYCVERGCPITAAMMTDYNKVMKEMSERPWW
eukprot:gene18323-20862_t